MKYSTKMVLVPQETMSQINDLNEKQKDGIDAQVFQLCRELQRILANESLTSEKQMHLYGLLFSRYKKLYNDSK